MRTKTAPVCPHPRGRGRVLVGFVTPSSGKAMCVGAGSRKEPSLTIGSAKSTSQTRSTVSTRCRTLLHSRTLAGP
eukprot:3492055-Prymnesium_polylepis.1